MIRKTCFLIMIFILLISIQESPAYDINVHERITAKAIDQNIENTNNYLKYRLGIENGVYSSVHGMSIRKHIEQGSIKEDDPFRYLNHFYNPISNSGLADFDFPYTGLSSFSWADDATNSYSWKQLREYHYVGLTAPMKIDRDKALANAFRTLGQIMHLIQDLAVPAHVRNDAHLVNDPYEEYARREIQQLNFAMQGPFNERQWAFTYSAPIQFWELGSYYGIVPYNTNFIGLSEYTNANFASEDTIFTESQAYGLPHRFPFPRKESAELYSKVINSNNGKIRKYFKIIKDTEPLQHFATIKRLYGIFDGMPTIQCHLVTLDRDCHKEYANNLIPKAVSYSSGLIDYFFRGILVTQRVPGPEIIFSNYTGERMHHGVVEIYYDAANNTRKKLPESYQVDEILPGQCGYIHFNVPPDMVGEDYIVVYRGGLGKELDTVISNPTDKRLPIPPQPIYY